MKVFIKPINTKEFVNQHGETMKLLMSASGCIWIYHNDCNEDYERINIFMLKYILNQEEQKVVMDFIDECNKIIDEIENKLA